MNSSHQSTRSLLAVFELLASSEHGLTSQEAELRLTKYGPNKLPEEKTDGIIKIFLRQFKNPLIYILMLASAIVFLMGEVIDGAIILFVIIFNSIIGSIQEGRAQNTLRAIKNYTQSSATVLRDGSEVIISDIEVVPGDVMILQEGQKVPADARVISENNLKTDESMLTGESMSVHKVKVEMLKDDLPTTEQKNMVFKGTNIVSGNGIAIV